MAVEVVDESQNHGENTKKYFVEDEICIRTSWVDANTALQHIKNGDAVGRKSALWVRKKLQNQLEQLGHFTERHSGKIIFVAILLVATFCVGLKSAVFVTDIERLWVQEGGRLERELQYVARVANGGGTTQQLLMQTDEGNVLHASALLTHAEVLTAATSVTVDVFDITWSFQDLCYAPSFPLFENPIISKILESLTPCAIITPLDCFWEGAKLLGPQFPVTIPGIVNGVKWSSLNPHELLQRINAGEAGAEGSFRVFADFMKRAGITTAYQEKPCLDPHNPHCPESAPNKKSKQIPNVPNELNGGCYGFAGNFMHWPEPLIMGGVTRNASDHITRANAIQSIVQLMGPRNLYEFWKDHYRVHAIDWTPDKADIVLDAWMTKFKKKSLLFNSQSSQLLPFSAPAVNKLLQGVSSISVPRIALAYIIMAGLGFVGIILTMLSVTAGLGASALLGLSFNAATVQVLPFLVVGLTVDHLFIITAENVSAKRGVENALKRAGVSVLVVSFSNICAFLAGTIIPIPALRVFCLQAALLILVTFTSVMVVFPAIMSLDLKRQVAFRHDVFCCFSAHSSSHTVKQVENRKNIVKSVHNRENFRKCAVKDFSVGACAADVTKHKQIFIPDIKQIPHQSPLPYGQSSSYIQGERQSNRLLNPDTMDYLEEISKFILKMKTWYCSLFGMKQIKLISIFMFIIMLLVSSWGVKHLNYGLDLSDVVPGNTPEFAFLHKQQQYFGFYNMFAVTQGDFEYPTKQNLLHEYYNAFARIKYIIKNDDGGLPDSWIVLFRNWLSGLQRAFDKDWKEGCLNKERWYSNASDDGILAYKLLVQTGHVDNPVDKNLLTQIRLVSNDGIINPEAFYNYLTAWVSMDSLAYSASQADLRPESRLWFFMLVALLAVFLIIFLFLLITLMNIWASLLLLLLLAAFVLQVIGALCLCGIKMSAVSAVLVIIAAGIGVKFTFHLTLAFITAIGDRNQRISTALNFSVSSVLHGAITLALSFSTLLLSEFDFINKYFFYSLIILVALGALNGLVFLPAFLSTIGPSPEIVPKGSQNYLPHLPPPVVAQTVVLHSTPQHGPTKIKRTTSSVLPPHRSSNASLTTITEESSSQSLGSSSHEIVVEPQVVVETTTYSPETLDAGVDATGSHVTTKVTATAKVKVEVHTALNRNSAASHCGTKVISKKSHKSSTDSGSRSSLQASNFEVDSSV